MASSRERWRYRAGRRPFTVTVEELDIGGNLYTRVWVKAKQDYTYRSLGHRDREQAMEYADRLAVQLREGTASEPTEKLTLERLFELYLEQRTTQKSPSTQQADHRKAELFLRVLGRRKDPTTIGRAEWERFGTQRGSGAIDPRGCSVPPDQRRRVRDGTAGADLAWLRAVIRWATSWRTPQGHYLMTVDPTRGLRLPKERNPRRVVATQDRFEKVRAVSDQVLMEEVGTGKRYWRRSYLSELLDIVNGTGRRISAVCQLRREDIHPEGGPHGAIRWRADSDKMGFEATIPIGPQVRAAVDRAWARSDECAAGYLFPSPRVKGSALRYELAGEWLRKAEVFANLPKQDGALWHAYRRKWATERKHLPDVDVAAAGGWRNARTLVDLYQRPDANTLLRVVLEGGELREGVPRA